MGAQYVRVQDSNLPNAAEVDKALLVFRYDSWPFDVGSWGAVSFRNVMEGWATVTNEGAATGTAMAGAEAVVAAAAEAAVAAAVSVARTSVGQPSSRQIRNQKWPATMPQRQTSSCG